MADAPRTSSTSLCECCKKGRCSKTLRIPVTTNGGRERIVKVCGRCVVTDTRKLHEWIEKLKADMEAGRA